MRRVISATLLTVSALAFAGAPDPLVSVWYRGTPAGTPVAEELAVIRALGFGGVVWPAGQAKGMAGVQTLAKAAGLQVTIGAAPKPVTAQSVLTPAERVDLIVTPQNAPALTPLIWRAVAHGARALAFDSGSVVGAGLENPDRSLKPWVHAAIDVARQFDANRRLIEALRPGPGVIVTPDLSPALDVVMLDADRSWAVIATNTSDAAVAATVRLPTGAPYAMWLNLLDGATLAMNGEAAGPRWSLKLDAHATRVYLIEKIMK